MSVMKKKIECGQCKKTHPHTHTHTHTHIHTHTHTHMHTHSTHTFIVSKYFLDIPSVNVIILINCYSTSGNWKRKKCHCCWSSRYMYLLVIIPHASACWIVQQLLQLTASFDICTYCFESITERLSIFGNSIDCLKAVACFICNFQAWHNRFTMMMKECHEELISQWRYRTRRDSFRARLRGHFAAHQTI